MQRTGAAVWFLSSARCWGAAPAADRPYVSGHRRTQPSRMSDALEANPKKSATSRPEMSASRWLLRALCIVATFFSACFAAHGVLMTGQFLNDDIPAGKIEAITGHTKTGPKLRLDTGREAVFSDQVLFQQPKPVELRVGDLVEKRRVSFVYVVNGTALTDWRWVLQNWLLPVRLLVPLGAYVIGGAIYVLAYRRTPLGDCVWSETDPKRPRRPRTRAGMIAAMLVTWLVGSGLVTTAFGCMAGCLFGIGKAVFG
jgi:hypothetical protein